MSAPSPDTFAELIGVRVERLSPGRTRAHLTIGPRHLNPHGTTHGSALYSLSGAAIAAALNDDLTSGLVWKASIEYLAPSREGDELTAEAVVGEVQGKDADVVVNITRAIDETLIATSVASAKIRPR